MSSVTHIKHYNKSNIDPSFDFQKNQKGPGFQFATISYNRTLETDTGSVTESKPMIISFDEMVCDLGIGKPKPKPGDPVPETEPKHSMRFRFIDENSRQIQRVMDDVKEWAARGITTTSAKITGTVALKASKKSLKEAMDDISLYRTAENGIADKYIELNEYEQAIRTEFKFPRYTPDGKLEGITIHPSQLIGKKVTLAPSIKFVRLFSNASILSIKVVLVSAWVTKIEAAESTSMLMEVGASVAQTADQATLAMLLGSGGSSTVAKTMGPAKLTSAERTMAGLAAAFFSEEHPENEDEVSTPPAKSEKKPESDHDSEDEKASSPPATSKKPVAKLGGKLGGKLGLRPAVKAAPVVAGSDSD